MITAQDFYHLFCNHKFKKVTETIQDGFTGMYFVLRILSEASNELTAGDISEMFGVSTARTAVILATLERKKLIEKSKSLSDARKTIVKITEKGLKTLNERKLKLFSRIDNLLTKLNEIEIKNFYNILEKMLA